MNMKEIAKIAGVSVSTVSKILNKKDSSISKETRERILKIAKEYNYMPYSSIWNNKNLTIGIIVSEFKFYKDIICGVIDDCQNRNYSVIVCDSKNDNEQELKNILSLCKNKVDAIILNLINEQSIKNISYIDKNNIPYVVLNNINYNNSINLGYEKYSYNLTKELILKNHKKIACIVENNYIKDLFLNGYKKCLFENNIDFDSNLVFEKISEDLLYSINLNNVTGFICSNYKKATQFYNFMEILHYKIPDDFSLVSLKSEDDFELDLFDISSYEICYYDFGKYLSDKVVSKLENVSEKFKFNEKFKLNSEKTLKTFLDKEAKKIIVVGSINVDTYLNVEKLPYTEHTITSSAKSSVYSGGKGMNQAIAVSKLGHKVSLIGRVGYDLYSNTIYKSLKEENVETSGVKRCKEADTGRGYIFLDNMGDSMISLLTGANGMLTPENIEEDEQLFKGAKYLLVQSEVPLDSIEKACDIAHKYKIKTILKPSNCDFITNKLLSKIDIIVPNNDELQKLCPKYSTLEEQAQELLNMGIEIVIVTLNEKGCYLKTKNVNKYFPSIETLVVDKTGASDAFISALVSYLLYGYDLEKAICIANYAAAFCISKEGVVPALVDKNSLERYIHQKEPELLNIKKSY